MINYEERLVVKKTARVKRLHDIIPQFSSLRAFYSLKEIEDDIEIKIQGIIYSTKLEGKLCYLEPIDSNDNFHDKMWVFI